MPLIQIQYSKNLEDKVAISELVGKVHEAGLDTGEISKAALRTMAMPLVDYAIADKDPANAFVHVIVRLKKREEKIRTMVCERIFNTVTDFFDEEYNKRPLSLSLEYIEIDTLRKNNIHERLK